ncbi:MAG: glycosyltransferase [Candidatus Sumerlaeia bacterium]|nr:glycosyltransferase [Candidatus Sumerlaeia bacterium]
MRVAFIHDWLNGMRGGERVLEVLCEEFPGAPIHTLIHEAARVSPAINAHEIHTSWFQRWRFARRRYRWLLPLMPRAAAGLRPEGVDAVVSLSHCVAKGASIPRGVPHLCYCFTPMRYVWDQFDQYIGGHTGGRWLRPALSLWRPRLQRWDVESARQVTQFIAISEHIARKIALFYGREAKVIHPPVNTEHFTPGEPSAAQDHYLVASALVPYKRVDLAIRAANLAGFRLRVVGEGPEFAALARLAGPTVEMTGWVTDERLREEYRACRALLFTGEEDFGLVPLEAHACGRPVIALRRGGVTESVVDGITGLFFDQQTPEALAGAVARFERRAWDPAACRARAEQFGPERFRRAMRAEIEHLVEAQRVVV